MLTKYLEATHIAAEASETETREQHQQQQLVTSRETLANCYHPLPPQMDGASDSMSTGLPSLLPEGANGSHTTTPMLQTNAIVPSSTYAPPSMSQHFPKHPCKVICHLCLADSHYTYILCSSVKQAFKSLSESRCNCFLSLINLANYFSHTHCSGRPTCSRAPHTL